MQTELLSQPAAKPGALPKMTRAELITCLALVGSMYANNADATDILDVCYHVDAPQKPADSIPPIERIS